MNGYQGLTRHMTEATLSRLLPRIETHLSSQIEGQTADWQTFRTSLDEHFPALFTRYHQLYGNQFDFYYHLEDLLLTLGKMWLERPADLRQLDEKRRSQPLWFQSNRMLGGVCYVDLFAGSLQGIREKIPYFKELGLTYLHLMPLYRVPPGDNDGGYAVSSYREVNPVLGTMEELESLARDLREQGISLVLDLIFNHTSDDHEWAECARSGNQECQDYYLVFPDRRMPDAYEIHLREIFPDEHPGSFTYCEEMGKWVWTTFHAYQWDLNYRNPAVFNRMAEEMLFLANIGVEVLRLDAVAFTWKELGTSCENLPHAHTLIRAFNAVARIAAPAMFFKSEAIVHPDEVNRYIDPDECQLSYNPLMMALLWNSLATRKVRLLTQALIERFTIHPSCAWVNYVRVHDDIGWTFSDEDAARLGINGYDHRRFLNQFYTGKFEGSFARGLTFQENQKTGDARISGTCASLAGLEKALAQETSIEVELAIRRILLIHGVILTAGGVPLIYLGDEIGTLNDYSYRQDIDKAKDSRWVHRPSIDWDRMDKRSDKNSIEGQVFNRLKSLIQLRKNTPALSGSELRVIPLKNIHALAYARIFDNQQVIVLGNFSENEQFIAADELSGYRDPGSVFLDLVSNQTIPGTGFRLEPYQFVILTAKNPANL